MTEEAFGRKFDCCDVVATTIPDDMEKSPASQTQEQSHAPAEFMAPVPVATDAGRLAADAA